MREPTPAKDGKSPKTNAQGLYLQSRKQDGARSEHPTELLPGRGTGGDSFPSAFCVKWPSSHCKLDKSKSY